MTLTVQPGSMCSSDQVDGSLGSVDEPGLGYDLCGLCCQHLWAGAHSYYDHDLACLILMAHL